MSFTSSTLIIFTALRLYAPCYSQADLQILDVIPSETEVYIEWEWNLTAPNSFILTLTYEGPCPNVSYISVEAVPNTARNHTFTGLEAYSTYTVMIEPTEETTMFETLPSAPELPPQNLCLARATPTALTVEWDPVPCLEQNSLITAYFVVVENETYSSSSNVSASGDLMFSAIRLEPTSIYTVRVHPVTSQFGISELFADLSFATLEGVRIASVEQLPAMSPMIFVNWTYPREAEYEVIRFLVYLTYVGPCNNLSLRFTSPAANRNERSLLVELPFIDPGSDYEVYVTATTAVEEAASQRVLISTILLAPPPPANIQTTVVTITAASFQWDPVPCRNRNVGGPLDYYVGVLSETQPEQTFLSNDDTGFVLMDLEPDTIYLVRVYTLPHGGSFGGLQGVSQPLQICTQPDLEVSASFRDQEMVYVTWTYPFGLTGSTTGFSVGVDYLGPCNVAPTLPPVSKYLVGPESRTAIFFELEMLSLYNFTVEVTNSLETRTASVTIITSEGSPVLTPQNVSVTDVTTSSITVEFVPSFDCLNHTIQFGRSGTSADNMGSLITTRTHTQTGLSRDTSYFFEIMSVVDPTFGFIAARSERIHVRTFSDITITLAAAEPTSLEIQWTLPVVEANPTIQARNQTVSIFYVGPCELDEVAQPSQVMVVSEEVRMIRLENLEELSNYSVMVTAEYPSETLSGSAILTTQAAVPASPPATLSIEKVTSTSISISWEPVPCLDRNSRIAGYIVEYGPTASYPETQSPVLQDLTFTIQDRQPNTSYFFQVYPVLEIRQGGLEELPVPRTRLTAVNTLENVPAMMTSVSSVRSIVIGFTVGVVVMVILLTAALVVGVVLLIRAKRNDKYKDSLDNIRMENCVAYMSPTSSTSDQPPDLALGLHSKEPPGHAVPPPPRRLLPATPEQSTHAYESIPYTIYRDTSDSAHTYNRLAHSELVPPKEERYDQVKVTEVDGEENEIVESYDDVV